MSGAERPIYLDHAASTPARPEVVEAMLPFLTEHHGNPSGSHAAARRSRRALDDARDQIAALVGCAPGDVVFTSGGTEADATAVAGAGAPSDGAIVTTATEHHAVLDAAAALERAGAAPVRLVGVGATGEIDLDDLAAALARPAGPVRLVSVALANNETGTIQDLDAVAEVIDRSGPGATLHTDAVQAAAWLDLPVRAARAELLSLSGHKLGGPKGIGALIVRAGTPLAPLVRGGGQERGRRSGTPNVAGAVGLGVAAEALAAERDQLGRSVRDRRDRLASALLAAVAPVVPGARETAVAADGSRDHLLPGHLHLVLPGVAADELLFLADLEGLAASAGASCSSGATEPSHVLAAMGLAPDEARAAVRLTLGRTTTDDDVERAVAVLTEAVTRIAGGAPAPAGAAR